MVKAAAIAGAATAGFLSLGVLASLGATPATTQAGGSFNPDARVGLDAEQLRNATVSLQVADSLHAPALAVLAMVVSALGESDFRVVPNGQGSGYCGVYQAHPDNIPCDDTREQATRFLTGGKGFQAGGAIKLAEQGGLSPGTIATLVEASGQPGSFYDKHRGKAERIIAAWRQGGATALAAENPTGTPKEIIDTIVLPIARRVGVPRTTAENDAANARHGPTVSGGLSDHQGPPDQRWAADMSNGSSPTPEMDALAAALAEKFRIPWTGSGLVSVTHGQYRYQLIYKTMEGGDHFNHVHFGVSLIAGPVAP